MGPPFSFLEIGIARKKWGRTTGLWCGPLCAVQAPVAVRDG